MYDEAFLRRALTGLIAATLLVAGVVALVIPAAARWYAADDLRAGAKLWAQALVRTLPDFDALVQGEHAVTPVERALLDAAARQPAVLGFVVRGADGRTVLRGTMDPSALEAQEPGAALRVEVAMASGARIAGPRHYCSTRASAAAFTPGDCWRSCPRSGCRYCWPSARHSPSAGTVAVDDDRPPYAASCGSPRIRSPG
ncbi:MAG: hypothetical protein R3E48_07670 [Burkholderiaceae bacterium]